ncbi:MAG TPA: glycosyltransferase family 39 protein [Pyrinomonadaceae bacterium]
MRSSRKWFAEKTARLRFRHLLMAAAATHVALCVLINLAGRFNLFPNIFDANGISSPLAFDSFYYRRKSIELVAALARGDVSEWFNAPFPLHVKLYSLSFAVMSPLFGFTMLSVEPLNLFYYLSILILVFKLGEELFDRSTGFAAALIIALWPSFLLHTTQLLRDPLFIAVTLVLVLIIARWLTREHSPRRGLLEALAGAAASAVIWLTRYNIWAMIFGFVLLGAVFLILRQRRQKRWLAGNLAGAALLLILMGGTPTIVGAFLWPDSFISEYPITEERLPPSPCPEDQPAPSAHQSGLWSRLKARADRRVMRLGIMRRRFAIIYSNAGSNLDACVPLWSVADMLRYLPRGVANGFLAPYPNMWLGTGNSVGFSGRLLSGMEMLVIYLIELLAILGLWEGRRRLPVWFMALFAASGIIALGLVVINVAVMFRMRYVFSMLLVLLGVRGARLILSRWSSQPTKSP